MVDQSSGRDRRVPLPRRSGRWRLLLGMVLANRPWLLAGSLSWWRLVIASVAANALIVGWLVIDGELWDSLVPTLG